MIMCAVFGAFMVSCSAVKPDVITNSGSMVNAKSVTLIGVTATLGKKPQLAAEFEKVSVALKQVTLDNAITVDDLKNIVLAAVADSSVKNKNLVMGGLAVVFDYYGNTFTLSDEKNAKYVEVINNIAAGIDEALSINSLTEGEVPASTK